MANFGCTYWVAWAQLTKIWLLFLASLALGLSSFAIQHSAARPPSLDNAVSEFSRVQAEFEFLDKPIAVGDFKNFRANIKLKSAVIENQSISFAARGLITGGQEIGTGDKNQVYSCRLELRPAPDNQRAGFWASCIDAPRLLRPAPTAMQWVSSVRKSFLESASGLSPDASGLVAGLAIGDTTLISQELKADMKAVSLTHLTAVSGANCAIVLAMAYLLVRKLGGSRWVRLVAGLITLVGYVALVGAQPSVLRASVMAGTVLIAISLGRKSSALGALAISIIILLIADPWLATDFGFALSVAATAGLLILTQPIAEKLGKHLPNWLALALAIAISAQVFCLPIILQLQDGLSTYALPANLLAEPLVAPVTVLGILAVLFAIPFPGLSQVMFFLASFGTWIIAWLAKYFASLPLTNLSWPTGIAGAIAAGAVIFGFVLWLKTEPNRLRNLGLTALALIFSISLGSLGFSVIRSSGWPDKNWQVVACDVGQGDALVVRSRGAVALIDVGRDDEPIDKCLSKLGIRKIDLLVLTHFDLDHVGGIRGALANRETSLVLVSPYEDDRWGATGTNQYLESLDARILPVEKGFSGTLGDFSWKVLSPNRNAAGAEDSNDASVSMIWSSDNFDLLTMADLGEPGQMRMSTDSSWWRTLSKRSVPLVLKVAHHGSADQYPELIEEIRPELSIISVGSGNSYGHPTTRTVQLLERTGSQIFRTDLLGSIAVSSDSAGLVVSTLKRD